MSEIEIFQKITNIKYVHDEDRDISMFIDSNRNNFKSSEMPDLFYDVPMGLIGSIGIEHTEVTIFKQNRKGSLYKQNKKRFKNEIFTGPLDFIEFSCSEIYPYYRKLLFIDNGRTFIENLKNAISEKSRKFDKYKKYKLNCLWIEVEDFIEVHHTFYHQYEIKKELVSSPYDTFIFGNSSDTILISKKSLLQNRPISINGNLTINTGNINNTTYTLLKDGYELKLTTNSNTTRISKNVFEKYICFTQWHFEKYKSSKKNVKVYINAKEVDFIRIYEYLENQWEVHAKGKYVNYIFYLRNNQISHFSHRVTGAKKGDKLHFTIPSQDDSELQKELSGVVNIFIHKDNLVQHYKHIYSINDLDNLRITEQ